MIRRYKSNRVIILTTHSMQEAEVLGDRIAILHEGRLRCAGSGMFLKKQYGSGYKLELAVNGSILPSKLSELTDLIRSKVDGAERVESRQHFARRRCRQHQTADQKRPITTNTMATTMSEELKESVEIDHRVTAEMPSPSPLSTLSPPLSEASSSYQPSSSAIPSDPTSRLPPIDLTYMLPITSLSSLPYLFHTLEQSSVQRYFGLQPNGMNISLNSLEEVGRSNRIQ